MKHSLLILLLVLITNIQSFSQTWPADTINTAINTGDPQFPFPQFMEYAAGKTLASNNAEGVTHADMEKTMREGYRIMMRRCLYTGKELDGKKYIVYNHSNVPHNYNTFVSEGDGYALLAAAYFADKEAFDGLWLWIHDNRMSKVKKYYDCTDLRPNYPHGPNMACWKCDETTDDGSTDVNSATDGDYDIAMGLLIAAAQWPQGMGINDACGNPISYRDEALNVMKALVDTVLYTQTANGDAAGAIGYLTGDIGIDGYCKNGNTWAEITDWRYSAANTEFAWANVKPDPLQVKDLYTDYIGPAYFSQFAKYLETNGGTPFQISQFLRGEASSDWLMGQMREKGYIASSGQCTVSDDGSVTTFGQHPSGPGGEDFRASWRTILNYVWHGNPTTTWNPATHQVDPVPNTFERDMGIYHADFLKNPRVMPDGDPHCERLGASPDPSCPYYKGVVNIKQAHLVSGANGSDNYRTNFNVGTGASAAVASEDLELIAEIYRQSEILWDGSETTLTRDATDDERYIKSTPKYFHDWFRVLGMLTTTGNLHPYGTMEPTANVKVYMSVDKTYAYAGDELTYKVSYRNFGSVDAASVSISTVLDGDYEFVSATNGGSLSAGNITWAIGTIPGFKTATGVEPTQGTVEFTVRIKSPSEQKRACLVSTITSSNAPTWTSNEYPNNASYTMERNCVDLLTERSLNITKTTDRAAMNPGDIANFKLEFENVSSPDLWLNGGRDKVVISYDYSIDEAGSNSLFQFYRFWHSAPEAYINMHNYRISYFMNDPAAIGLYNATTNPTGWAYFVDNQNDLDKYFYNPATLPAEERITFTHQPIPWGSNADGSWNQRIMIRFANVLTAPTSHIYDKLDNIYLIHKGVIGPSIIRTRMESTPPSVLNPRIADDWSYLEGRSINTNSGQDRRLSPISPGWANYDNPGVEINNYSKDVCDADVPNFEKMLVEEFDGYTWRRIAGTGPLPGRESYNVQVIDTIPKDLEWMEFTDEEALGITAVYTPAADGAAYSGIVTWTIPVMMVGDKGDLGYRVTAKDLTPPCPSPDKNFVNIAYILSPTDSPDTSKVNLKITCNPVPPTRPVETSLKKTADKTNVEVGDVVTYTLDFTNTDGAIVTWATGTASDWQTLGTGTTMPDMDKTSISLDVNDNTTKAGTNGYAFGHKKSHGVNGTVEASIDPSNSSPLSFIYRHSGGTPGQADFQGVELKIEPNPMGGNTINFEVIDNATSIADLDLISYGGSSDPINIKTELIDDQLFIWINTFTGAPLKVISGITQTDPGYVGIFASNAQQKIAAWKTHFDSSFDLAITDVLPEQLSTPTGISDDGTFADGTITWPVIDGPILGGTSTIRTFQATVNSCADFITNIGNATVYGIDDISSQNVIRCGSATCIAPVITSEPTGEVCSGTAQEYTITSDISTATFSWSREAVAGISNEAVTGETSNTITENLINTTAEPIVVRYIITPTQDTCKGTPFNYEVTVNVAPVITSPETGGVCSDSEQNYEITSSITSATYTWSRAAVEGISNAAVTDQTANPITEALVNTGSTPVTVRYVIVPDVGGCIGAPFNYDVTVTNSMTITSPAEATACSGSPVGYEIVSNISTATFTWSRAEVDGISNAEATGMTDNPIDEILINTTGASVVANYVITASAPGCPEGEPFNLAVTVNPAPVFTSAETGEICSGEIQNYEITTEGGDTEFLWTRLAIQDISNTEVIDQPGNQITEALINTGTSPVIVTYDIRPAAEGCAGALFSYNVTVNPASMITSDSSAEVCSGTEMIYNITSNLPSATITWSRAAVEGVSLPELTDQTSNPISETLTLTGSAPATVTYIITPSGTSCPGIPLNYEVTINPVPVVTSDSSGAVCGGAEIVYDITSNVASATFIWSREAVAGISNPAVANQTADPISETLVNTGTEAVVVKYLILPAIGTCAGDPFEYEVTVSNSTVITTQPPSTNVCSGGPLNLSVEATGNNISYQWKYNGVAIADATENSFTIPSATSENAGQYTVDVTSDCGPITSEVAEVIISEIPSNDLSVAGGIACEGTNGSLTVVNAESGVRYEAFIDDRTISTAEPGNGSDIVLSLNAGELSVGRNTISVRAIGCSTTVLTMQAEVDVTALPLANAGENIELEDYAEVTLDGSASSKGTFTYLWTSSDPMVVITDPNAISTTAMPKILSTDFTLTVTDNSNTSCIATDIVNVKVKLKPLVVPDAFSPNGDNIHDVFDIPEIRNYPKAILYVYNQWGELIYKSAPGYGVPWDGTRNGKPVPLAAYYYILELHDGTPDMAGSITIIK